MKKLGLSQPKDKNKLSNSCHILSSEDFNTDPLSKQIYETSEVADPDSEDPDRDNKSDRDKLCKNCINSRLDNFESGCKIHNGFNNYHRLKNKILGHTLNLEKLNADHSINTSISSNGISNAVPNFEFSNNNRTIKKSSLECLIAHLHRRVDDSKDSNFISHSLNKTEGNSIIRSKLSSEYETLSENNPSFDLMKDEGHMLSLSTSGSEKPTTGHSNPLFCSKMVQHFISGETVASKSYECKHASSNSIVLPSFKDNVSENISCKVDLSCSNEVNVSSVITNSVVSFPNYKGISSFEAQAKNSEKHLCGNFSSPNIQNCFNNADIRVMDNDDSLKKDFKLIKNLDSMFNDSVQSYSNDKIKEGCNFSGDLLQGNLSGDSVSKRDKCFENSQTKLNKAAECCSNQLISEEENLNDNGSENVKSNSSTPLFSETPSDGSQSEMMIKISDAVAALLSNYPKDAALEPNNVNVKECSSDKLFSNSNSSSETSENDINFSCAFKILNLLPEKASDKNSEISSPSLKPLINNNALKETCNLQGSESESLVQEGTSSDLCHKDLSREISNNKGKASFPDNCINDLSHPEKQIYEQIPDVRNSEVYIGISKNTSAIIESSSLMTSDATRKNVKSPSEMLGDCSNLEDYCSSLTNTISEKVDQESDLIKDHEKDSCKLVKSNEKESCNLIKDPEKEPCNLIKESCKEHGQKSCNLIKKHEEESCNLIKEHEESCNVIKEHEESCNVIKEHQEESCNVIKEHQEESCNVIKEHEKESCNLIKEHEEESCNVIKEHQEESCNVIKEHQEESCNVIKEHEKESCNLIKEHEEESCNLINEQDESCNVIKEHEEESCNLIKEQEESCNVIKEHQEESCNVIKEHQEESCNVIKEHEEESCNLINEQEESCNLIKEHEESCNLIKEHEEESCNVIKEHEVESCSVIKGHEEESCSVIKGHEEESRNLIKENEESCNLIKEYEEESCNLIKEHKEESCNVIKGQEEESCNMIKKHEKSCNVIKEQEESCNVIKEPEEESCSVIKEHEEESCNVIKEHEEESCNLIKEHEEESCNLIKEHEVESYNVIREQQEESYNVIKEHEEESCNVIREHEESCNMIKEHEEESCNVVKEHEVESYNVIREQQEESYNVIKEHEEESCNVIREHEESCNMIKEHEEESCNVVKEHEKKSCNLIKEHEEESCNVIKNQEQESCNMIKEHKEESWNAIKEHEEESWNAIKEHEEESCNVIKEHEEESCSVIKEHEEESCNLIKEHEEESCNVIKEHEEESCSVIKEHEEESCNLIKEHEEESCNMIKEHEEESCNLIKEHEEESCNLIKEHEEESCSVIKEHEEESCSVIKEHEEESHNVMKEHEEESCNVVKEHEEESHNVMKEHEEESCNVVKEHEEESCNVIKEHEEESCSVIKEHEEELCNVIKKHEEESCSVIKEHQEESCNLIKEHQEESCNVIKEHEEESCNVIKEHEEESCSVIKEHEEESCSVIKEHEEESCNVIKEHEEESCNVIKEHEEESCNVIKENDQESCNMITEHEESCNVIKESCNSSKECEEESCNSSKEHEKESCNSSKEHEKESCNLIEDYEEESCNVIKGHKEESCNSMKDHEEDSSTSIIKKAGNLDFYERKVVSSNLDTEISISSRTDVVKAMLSETCDKMLSPSVVGNTKVASTVDNNSEKIQSFGQIVNKVNVKVSPQNNEKEDNINMEIESNAEYLGDMDETCVPNVEESEKVQYVGKDIEPKTVNCLKNNHISKDVDDIYDDFEEANSNKPLCSNFENQNNLLLNLSKVATGAKSKDNYSFHNSAAKKSVNFIEEEDAKFCSEEVKNQITNCNNEERKKVMYNCLERELFCKRYINLISEMKCSYVNSKLKANHWNFNFIRKSVNEFSKAISCLKNSDSNIEEISFKSLNEIENDGASIGMTIAVPEKRETNAEIDLNKNEACSGVNDIVEENEGMSDKETNFQKELITPLTDILDRKGIKVDVNLSDSEFLSVNDICEKNQSRNVISENERDFQNELLTLPKKVTSNANSDSGDVSQVPDSALSKLPLFKIMQGSGTLSREPERKCLDTDYSKRSYTKFIQEELPLISGPCVLCNSSFHVDLNSHSLFDHSCIAYIPVYQTNTFFHHMRERIGNVTHSYSDDLYGNPFYICKICGSIFKSMNSVRLHLNVHKEIFMIVSSSQNCSCRSNHYSYIIHEYKKLFKKNFVCSFCNRRFSCESSLMNHLKVVHFFKRCCQICDCVINYEDNVCILKHNRVHSSENDFPIPFTENLEEEKDQTFFSWNTLLNQLNYYDGRSYRLEELKEQSLKNNWGTSSLRRKVDLEYVEIPSQLALSPASAIKKYLKHKVDSKIIDSEVDFYASKHFDMPIQNLLKKKFTLRKVRKCPPLYKRKKFSLLMYFNLQNTLHKKERVENQKTLPQSTRRKYARKAKLKSSEVVPVNNKEQLKKNASETCITLSRTRSGMQNRESQKPYIDIKDDVSPEVPTPEITGEWVNSHTYVCCSCGAVFLDLAEIMDHKWDSHPGVWCAHTMIHGQENVPKMFCEQYLPPYFSTSSSPKTKNIKIKNNLKENLTCSLCKQKFKIKEEFHLHIIDCGGLNLVDTNKKKQKKGLRFKRRKGQGVPSRRYASTGLSSTPQKNIIERGSERSSPNEEINEGATSMSSHSLVKRKLEVNGSSESKIQLKSKLNNILMKRTTRSEKNNIIPRKKNLKMKLRKKIRESRNAKDSNYVAGKLSKTVGKSNILKRISTDSSVSMHQEEVLPDTNNQKRRNTKNSDNQFISKKLNNSKLTSRKASKNVKDDKLHMKVALSKREKPSMKIVKNKIKTMVPLINSDFILDEQSLNISKHDLPLNKNVVSSAKKNCTNSSKCLKIQKKVQGHICKRIKGKYKMKESDSSNMEDDMNEENIPPLKANKRLRKSGSKDSYSDHDVEESDSYEPEVIRNFRRRRFAGRSGLRKRKFLEIRYSLRPSVCGSKNELKDEDKEVSFEAEAPCDIQEKENCVDESGEENQSLPSSECSQREGKLLQKLSNLNEKGNIPKGNLKTDSKLEKISDESNLPKCKKTDSGRSLVNTNISKTKDNILSLTEKKCSNKFSSKKDYKSSCFKTFSTSPKNRTLFGPKTKRPLASMKLKSMYNFENQRKHITSKHINKTEKEKTAQKGKTFQKYQHLKKSMKIRKKVLTPEIVETDSDSDSLSDVPLIRRKKKDRDKLCRLLTGSNENVDEKDCPVIESSTTSVGPHKENNKLKRKSVESRSINKKPKLEGKNEKGTKQEEKKPNKILSSDLKPLNKLKPKRKYALKKRFFSTDKIKHKTEKEVKVLSYKSINTIGPEFSEVRPNLIGKPELEEKGIVKSNRLKKAVKKGISENVDENSPSLSKLHKDENCFPLRLGRNSHRKSSTDVVGFPCRDCGLSFDSTQAREDHHQDCRNIAFEMSLMAEDHLYECPYCQLTFVLKGTQRKHMVSCRMSRSRKYAQRRRKLNRKIKPNVNDNGGSLSSDSEVPCSPPISLLLLENQNVAVGKPESEIEFITNRFNACCQKYIGLKEICSLLIKYCLSTNELRYIINNASSSKEDSNTSIELEAQPSPHSSQEFSNYITLVNMLRLPNLNDTKREIDNVSKSLFKRQSNVPNLKSSKTVISVDISKSVLLKALSSIEELLKEAASVQSSLKKQEMLLTMKHTFQAGTCS